MKRGNPILADRQIRHTVERYPPIAPGLRTCPFDQVVVVKGLSLGEQVASAVRGSRTPEVCVDNRVTARHPDGRIGGFPTRHFGELDGARLQYQAIVHGSATPAPCVGRYLVLSVRVGGHDHGQRRNGSCRTKDIDAKHSPISNRDWHIPIHLHARRQRSDSYIGPDCVAKEPPSALAGTTVVSVCQTFTSPIFPKKD